MGKALPKLTKPQTEALRRLVRERHATWGTNWPPATKLVALGLASRRPRGLQTSWFTITEAGLAHPSATLEDHPHARRP